jgi:hypothetical protein
MIPLSSPSFLPLMILLSSPIPSPGNPSLPLSSSAQIPISAADAAVLHSGSRTPLGSWGEDAVLTPKILSETAQFYRRSQGSSRSSTSPCTRMQNFEKATIQALKEDNRKVYYGEAPDSANGRTPPLSSQGSQGSGSGTGTGLRMDSPPVSRGTPPLFVPKVGAFSAKIPAHAIQPFVKKEEQVWVPGKFATDSVPGMANSVRDLNNNSSMMSNSLHKDNRGKLTSSNGIAGRLTPSGGSMTPVGYGDRGRNSPTMNQGGMGQGMGSALGPGLLTGKTAIMHSRSCELLGTEGPGGNYPFMSGRSIDNSDVQFDAGDFNVSTDRHRANQQALAGRHQLLARQKNASSNSIYGRSPSEEQGYHSAVTSGQRSPVTPSMSQRLTPPPPQSHSSPHLLSNIPPLISNPSFLLSQLQMQSSIPPPYTSNLSPALPPTPYEIDHLKKVGFEAQLPSFLREL